MVYESRGRSASPEQVRASFKPHPLAFNSPNCADNATLGRRNLFVGIGGLGRGIGGEGAGGVLWAGRLVSLQVCMSQLREEKSDSRIYSLFIG